jgi:uncharacterized protein involved in exopolysaccharide biosynthesis
MASMPNFADTDRQAGRAFARREILAGRRHIGRDEPALPPEPTVTLSKIGDFLEIDFRRLFGWLRRGLAGTLALALAGALAGGLYAALERPVYTVTTEVVIGPSDLRVVPNDLHRQPSQIDARLRLAGSKLRVLTSGNVLRRVVDQLDLVHDSDFYDPHPAGFDLSSLMGQHGGTEPADPRLAALQKLERDVKTRADPNSFVADLDVSARTADKAIRISKAIVAAYRDEMAKADAVGAARAAAALDARLAGLKQDVETAEHKVAAYKEAHDLVAANGQSVTAQAMTELNSQVVTAQTRLVAADAAYAALRRAGRGAVPADATAAANLATLRDQADSLRQQLEATATTYGPRHPTILRLKAQLAAAVAQVDAAVGRAVARAKSARDQAQAALSALEQRRQALAGSLFTDDQARIGLDQLQHDADAKGAIYKSFLARAQQLRQTGQIDTTNVRVISTAVPPARPSWPPRPALLIGLGFAGALFAGLLLSILLGAWGAWGDRRAARRLGLIGR